MNTMKNNAEIKASARKYLKGNYPTIIGCLLIYSIIASCISTFTEISNAGNASLQYLILFALTFIVSVITIKLRFGLASCFLKICCGQKPRIADVFSSLVAGGHNSTMLAVGITLIEVLCLIPFALSVMFTGEMMYLSPIIPIVLSGISLIMLIYYKIVFVPVYYLIHDVPNKSAFQIMLISSWMLKNNKMKLFKLMLSFIPLYILGITSFGIGLLWIIPYMQCSEACFYLDLTKNKATE